MQEIKIHGRGGQGAVTSAELIAIAAINKGNFAQAFPSFGPERRGAPVVAFSRIDTKKILVREKVGKADVMIVFAADMLDIFNPSNGLKDNGILIINTPKSADEFKDKYSLKQKIITVDANKIAMEEMGRVIVNTTMIGAFLKTTDLIKLEDFEKPLITRFGDKLGNKNLTALKRALNESKIKE